MNDIDRRLRQVDSLSAPDLWGEIETMRPRQERVERPRGRGLTVALALGLAATGMLFAARAFVFSSEQGRPGDGNVPPNSGTVLFIDDRTGVRNLSFKVYSVVEEMFSSVGSTEMPNAKPSEVVETSEILYSPEGEELARRLESRFFRGAPVTEGTAEELTFSGQPVDVTLILGSDYQQYPITLGIAAFELAESFVDSRNRGAGAEAYLSLSAAAQYERHEGGLQLYEYWPEGQEFNLGRMTSGDEEHSYTAVVSAQPPAPPPEDPDQMPSWDEGPIVEEELAIERRANGEFLITHVWRLPPKKPLPGATPTSEESTPAPVEMSLQNSSGTRGLNEYAVEWVGALGPAAHHGGYEVGEVTQVDGDVPQASTIIYRDPGYESEAVRLEQLLFPGAEIRNQTLNESAPLHVVLGNDFAERHADFFRAFQVVDAFGRARSKHAAVDSYVTKEVARFYREDRYASMYEYAEGSVHDVAVTDQGGAPLGGEDGWEFMLTFFYADFESNTERVRVDEVEGQLRIVEGELVAGSSG